MEELTVVARQTRRRGEQGYTLVALLALMTLLALFAMAAAPSIHQQVQRERETEAIFRGEEIAEAIRLYYKFRGQQGINSLPTSMDQLLEGIQKPGSTQKIQILRPEAARDPLSASGEWRMIRPSSQELIKFEQAVALYAGGNIPQPKDPAIALLQGQAVPRITNILNPVAGEAGTGPTASASPSPSASAAEDLSDDSGSSVTGPIIGVASRSAGGSVITYYGIDHHDQWIFTPLFR